MAYNILVPQVGQDLTEATIIELHVKLGDRVTKGDLVAVVESEKASFEVEAFASGVVISLPYAAGDVATVLTPLMILGEAGEAAATAAVQTAGPAASPAATVAPDAILLVAAVPVAAPISGGLRASPAARRLAAERGLDVAGIAGSGPDGAVVLRDVGPAQIATPALSAGGIALRTLPLLCLAP